MILSWAKLYAGRMQRNAHHKEPWMPSKATFATRHGRISRANEVDLCVNKDQGGALENARCRHADGQSEDRQAMQQLEKRER